jgi:hypothetical protein
MIAIFLPCVAVRMWLSSVVLPLPRKPVSTVAGTRSTCAVVVMGEHDERVRRVYEGEAKCVTAR